MPWIPPTALVFSTEKNFSTGQVRSCLFDCFKSVMGEERLRAELATAGFNDLAREDGPNPEFSKLVNAFEILKVKATEFCDAVVVQRSARRLEFFFNNCAEKKAPEAARAEFREEGGEEFLIAEEEDIGKVRNATMTMARKHGFSTTDSTGLATVVSELARNIYRYAGEGKISLIPLTNGERKAIKINAVDYGPGISNLDEIMSGRYRSRTGLGMGIRGSKNLMDIFNIDSAPKKGTNIVGIKYVR